MWTEVWDDYWYEYLGWKGGIGKAVERTAVRMPDTVIAISEYMARELRTIGRTKNVEVVHNGVDYHGIQEISAADTSWDVVYLGRLIEHKNVDMVLEAVGEASERLGHPVSCGIIGDGPQREELETYAEEVGVSSQVEFLGFVEDDEEVIANLKASKVYVLPSQQEGFSNSILEANACGVPSIITDEPNSGNTAIVEDGKTGFVVDPDVSAIADRLVDILEDDSLQRHLSEGADTFGENHDWGTIVEQTESVYEGTLEREGYR
jgi:glycosyltransferase involved in cell wall biosynthesis